MAGHEGGDPVLVLGPQDGAGDIDDAPALLDETQRALERLVLILDALFERAGAHAPFGVGVAPPGAGAGAGRVDQHEIAASFEVGEHVRLPPRRPDLDIARARAGEPGEDRRKAMRVGVGGVDLALVLHRGGERQRLAARARAKVEDLHAGLGFGEERGELRALVLQLDEALDIGRVGGERRRAAVRAHGDAQADRRERRRLGLEMGERTRAPCRDWS